jgi:hypothetical protein
MKYFFFLGLAGAVGLATACGSDDHPAVSADEGGSQSGGKAGKSGKVGGSHSGGNTVQPTGGEGGAAASGLVVVISSPAAASDPATDEVIVAEKVTVVCSLSAEDVDTKVDGSTVKLEVLDSQGKPALGQDNKPFSAPGVPTGNVGEYSAQFVMSTIPTGVVSFRCSGSSVDKTKSGEATLSTFVDHGPTIVAILPEADSAHPLEGIMSVEFTVSPTELVDGDEGAAVAGVTLQVAGVDIKPPLLEEDHVHPGTYRAEIDFTDGALFKEAPPEHTSVHIEAVNARMPSAATAINDYPVVVDGQGPLIAYTKPAPNATAHGETIIQFTAADDGAGIDVDTLELSLPTLPPDTFDAARTSVWSRTGNTFTYRFDTAILTTVASQITVSIRAEDLAGNLTDGVTLTIYKDDFPPAIDLDAGNARIRDAQKVCSKSFDPLFDALGDGAKTDVTFNLFRSVVYDQFNIGSGQETFYFSGVNPGSVRLYIQPNPSEPFLKDSNNDGVCDALAREDFQYVSLNAVKKEGGYETSDTDGATPPLTAGECTLKPLSTIPLPLCGQHSDMTAVVQHDVSSAIEEPCIYGYNAQPGPDCTGTKLELHSYTTSKADDTVSLSPDGWICLAVRASDKLNNLGISRPLRICLDDPKVPGVPACMTGAPAPSCVTDCSAPPAFGPHIYKYQ